MRLPILLLLPLAVGCAGPPVAAPIEGEPICPDVEMGTAHTRMVGGLRLPVRLRILDGKNVMMKTVIAGKRTPADPPAHTYIIDDNAEYTVEWAQCENERAPSPADTHGKSAKTPRFSKEGGAYECGEAKVYKTDTLRTKKHDTASHTLTFVPPPAPECWAGAPAPAVVAPPAAVDAGAPSGGTEAAQAPLDAGGDASNDAAGNKVPTPK